jgi:hypothetical protein
MTKRWKVVLICCIVALFAIALLPFYYGVYWVGHSDLRAVFVTSDAETGRLVPSAIIEFRSEGGGLCQEDRDEARYSLQADATGKLTRKWTGCMCFGTKSLMQDTFAVHLPLLWFRASAPGYDATEWVYLDDQPYRRAVRRAKGLATLDVKIALRSTSPHLTLDRPGG